MKKNISKIFAMILTLIMMVSLTACGGGSEAGEGDEKELKIGVILVGDENEGYTYAHIEGIKNAMKALNISDEQVTWKYSIPEDESCFEAAADLADSGCQIVFSNSYGHQSYMVQAAEEYPDVTFCPATGDTAAVCGLDNVKNYFTAVYESRYVSGVVAGMKLKELLDSGEVKEPKVGYVGAYPYAEVVSGYTAFYLGIKSIVPEAFMEVTYTNAWFDIAKEGEAANKLMSDGCVIIGQHADSTGAPAAVQAALDSGKVVYSVGYNVDMLSAAPDAALTSATNVWEVYYEYAINAALKGEEIATDWCEGYNEGAVAITPLGKSCAEGTEEKVEEVIAQIKDGSLHVFDTSTFTVKGKAVETNPFDFSTMNADYSAVLYEGPTKETIADGYFHESEFRSAPYFDLRIDGITELN